MRLRQGDFAAETVYDDDPVRVACAFAAGGARWIHMVDLDAARTGVPAHLDEIRAVAHAVDCHIEAGGGVRSIDAAGALLDTGVTRVVVGTAAVETPELVRTLTGAFPGRVAVGLDARGREVATRGWVEGSGSDLVELARRLEHDGVAALVVTEIGRDGTLEGPEIEQLVAVLSAVSLPVVASGGVGRLDDLRALVRLRADGRRLAGAIVGRALYEGCFDVAAAVAAIGEA